MVTAEAAAEEPVVTQNVSGQAVGSPAGAILKSRAMSKSQTIITASLDFHAPKAEQGEGGIGCLFMPDFEDGPMRLVTISPQGPAGREDLSVGDVLLEVVVLNLILIFVVIFL